ncbi:MAG: DUF6602 domain-containing protein [Planctomycetota bacterium]
MPGEFFERLRRYYLDVAAVLRGEAQAASIFPNPTDVGGSREQIYAEFLRQHAPSKCNVMLGGFLFGEDGRESGQLDVLATTDTIPQFNLHNRGGHGKSFSPVEGALFVASIKSRLDKQQLEDALSGLAAIPPTKNLEGRVSWHVSIKNYEDWPYKLIYATDGVSAKTLQQHLNAFYAVRPDIPLGRRPNMIHVLGKYIVSRAGPETKFWNYELNRPESAVEGTFHVRHTDADLQGIMWAINALQERAAASTHILYSFGNLINHVNGLPPYDESSDS